MGRMRFSITKGMAFLIPPIPPSIGLCSRPGQLGILVPNTGPAWAYGLQEADYGMLLPLRDNTSMQRLYVGLSQCRYRDSRVTLRIRLPGERIHSGDSLYRLMEVTIMKSYRMATSALAGAILASVYTIAPAQTTPAQSDQGRAGSPSASANPSSGASTGTTTRSGAGAATVTVPMVVLVPVDTQPDSQLNNGCWVRLTDNDATPKKGNDILTIVGRMYMPSFETPTGVNWSRKADALTVGPKAAVKVFSDPNYQGSSATLRGGQQVKDLSKELGFVQSIDSLQVDCTA